MDHRLWHKAQSAFQHRTQQDPSVDQQKPLTLQEFLTQTSSLCCCTDSTQINAETRAGVGWILYNPRGECILKGLRPLNQRKKQKQ